MVSLLEFLSGKKALLGEDEFWVPVWMGNEDRGNRELCVLLQY
jgi:hypothetical protein